MIKLVKNLLKKLMNIIMKCLKNYIYVKREKKKKESTL